MGDDLKTTDLIALADRWLDQVDCCMSRNLVEAMSTDALKALWDREDWPPSDVIDGVFLDHVHAELNRRGEGEYCAV